MARTAHQIVGIFGPHRDPAFQVDHSVVDRRLHLIRRDHEVFGEHPGHVGLDVAVISQELGEQVDAGHDPDDPAFQVDHRQPFDPVLVHHVGSLGDRQPEARSSRRESS